MVLGTWDGAIRQVEQADDVWATPLAVPISGAKAFWHGYGVDESVRVYGACKGGRAAVRRGRCEGRKGGPVTSPTNQHCKHYSFRMCGVLLSILESASPLV